MVLHYLDDNIVVQYIQVFLREVSGMLIKNTDTPDDLLPKLDLYNDLINTDIGFHPYYRYGSLKDNEKAKDHTPTNPNYKISSDTEITVSESIKVTGYFDEQTYTALALWMGINYPEEGFPYYYSTRWTLDDDDSKQYLYKTDYNSGLENDIDDSKYKLLLRYIISSNLEFLPKCIKNSASINGIERNFQVLEVDERVLSYIFGEVVSANSDPDEIWRVQKLLYPDGLNSNLIGVYFDGMKEKVKSIQERAVNFYQNNISDTSLYNFYSKVKVTGLIDPWTEYLIKQGIFND